MDARTCIRPCGGGQFLPLEVPIDGVPPLNWCTCSFILC